VDGDLDPAPALHGAAPRGEAILALEHGHVLDAERRPDPVDRLPAQVDRTDAGEGALAQRDDHGLLLGLAAQALLGLEPLGDVAPDREQHRALLGGHDAPAHLAHELAAVAAQPVRAIGEAERVLEREVQVHVAPVARPHAVGPEHLDRLADQLVAAVAELGLRQPVDEDDPAVRC
jgi:hypothetical protein